MKALVIAAVFLSQMSVVQAGERFNIHQLDGIYETLSCTGSSPAVAQSSSADRKIEVRYDEDRATLTTTVLETSNQYLPSPWVISNLEKFVRWETSEGAAGFLAIIGEGKFSQAGATSNGIIQRQTGVLTLFWALPFMAYYSEAKMSLKSAGGEKHFLIQQWTRATEKSVSTYQECEYREVR